MSGPVLVFGTGALATVVAARLVRAGVPVAAVGTWTEALARLAAGATVEGPDGAFTVRVPTLDRRGPLPRAALAFVLVKAPQTSEVAGDVFRALSPEGLALTLQNGLGNRERLAAVLGEARVAAGVSTVGATLLAPAHAVEYEGEVTVAGAEPAAALLERAGFAVVRTEDASALLWTKLAVNCAINPLAALLNVPNGALLQRAEWRARMAAAAGEVAAVARGRGIALPADPVALATSVAARTARNACSMLQDLRRGAETEIDALCGAVVREARALGLSAPVNERLWREVRALTARRSTAALPALP